MNICVFASSSEKLGAVYYEAAEALGARLAKAGHTVVFGAGADGLMGALARGAKEADGRLVGIIPKAMNRPGVAYAHCDELLVTETMHERKALMAERSDAYIALPGGFGTFEELLEAITYKQLSIHAKPIAIVNTEGFYDHLIAQFESAVRQRFAGEGALALFGAFELAEDAAVYIEKGERTAYRKHDWLDEW